MGSREKQFKTVFFLEYILEAELALTQMGKCNAPVDAQWTDHRVKN